MNLLRASFITVLSLLPVAAWALDPPHDISNSINCINCHTPHGAAGGRITLEAGNPNLCMTCHTPAGLATGFGSFGSCRAPGRQYIERPPAFGRRF